MYNVLKSTVLAVKALYILAFRLRHLCSYLGGVYNYTSQKCDFTIASDLYWAATRPPVLVL